MSSFTLPPFTPLAIPTRTTLRMVNPTAAPALLSRIASAYSDLQWASDTGDIDSLSAVVRGAEASLSIIDAVQLLATATDDATKAEATQAIFNATLNLKELKYERDAPKRKYNPGANALALFLMGTVFLFTTAMFVVSRYTWFNVTWFLAFAIETAGYVSRILLHYVDDEDENIYRFQYVAITVAPIFTTAAFYFFFAHMAVIYGRSYSVLGPMVYSYIFILCDVGALLVQVVGGVFSSSSTAVSASAGRWIMVGGIAFQVLAMTVYLGLWFLFLWRVYFSNDPQTDSRSQYGKGLLNFCKLLFNGRDAEDYKRSHLEQFFSPLMAHARESRLFHWFPLALTVASLVVYARCVYRIVELAQGWQGYLVSHEAYLMVFEALLVAICGWIFIFFHPVFVFGRSNRLRVKDIKKKRDLEKSLIDENGLEVTRVATADDLLFVARETSVTPLV